MPRYLPLLCLIALTGTLVGCSKSSDTTDIGDPKTREAEARNNMQNVLASDPSLKGPNGGPNPTVPHAAPPGAPMGSMR